MSRLPVTLLVAILCFLTLMPLSQGLRAQEAEAQAPVFVSAVRFSGVKAAGQADSWLVAEIDVTSRGDASKSGNAARYLEDVRIELCLATERSDDRKSFHYYRSSVTPVALPNGKSVVRFYLPCEIVKRDGLALSAPEYWAVVLSIGGAELPTVGKALSSKLSDPNTFASFKKRLSSEAAKNDGVLVPQYDSPFAGTDLRDVPSFVRRSLR